MTLILIIVTLACNAAHIADACADWINEVPTFCWGGQRLHQHYCPGIKDNSQYTCFRGSTLGCACSTLYRAMDGKCVRLEECGAHEHIGADIKSGTHMRRVGTSPLQPSRNAAVSATATVAAPVDDLHVRTTKLIQRPDVLELLMMSVDSWVHNECLCLKSTRLEDTVQGANRTIDCYAYTKWLNPPVTIATTHAEKLVKLTRKIEVTVEKKTCNITVHFRHAERVNHTSHTDSSLFGLMNEYAVLVAKDTCVTLTYISVEGKPQCMIWGTRNGDKIEENDCENDSVSLCGEMAIAIENPHTDPCELYDVFKE
ncbi:uncharacterized protein LOC142766944 isoform X2 [Rhipicephalus microplus]